ncbi:MAG: type IX secretion system protein PorQ [Bacteroidota bacterium]
MKHGVIFLILLPLSISCVLGQIGGRNTYDFLNLTPSARLVSLGGVNISTLDDDPNFASQNPALLNSSMHKHATASFSSYLAGINYGYAGYVHHFDSIGTFHSGVQYLNSGDMQGADEFGNLTGTFAANELVWMVGMSRQWRDKWRYGANLKFISSTLAPGFSSVGMAMDLAGSYKSKNELFTAGLVVRNLGTQFTTYTGGADREPLPFDIVAGVSNKLKYMPMRFSLTATNIDNPILIYVDPDPIPQFDLSGNPIEPPNQTLDQIFRHFIFSTEFLLGSFLRLRAGYNHLRRQELRSENRGGLTGFSLGFGIRANRFAFDYGFSAYGISNAFQVNQFSLTVNLGERQVRKRAIPNEAPVEETKD